MVILLVAAPAARAADPIDHAQPPAADGTPICAAWVHDQYTVERAGRTWATWHPPRDPRYGCAFGHEHGSNPRAFRYFGRTGMPAFGLVSDFAGSPEAHAGFKVFVANEDRKGLAWMIVLHQGSGSPRRGSVRFHSLETWLFRERGRRMLARTRQMADFGEAVPNCPGVQSRASWRLLPVPGCRSSYEEWATALDVGGVFQARPAFGIHNAITQFDPADPERVIFNKKAVCGRADPAGWDSRCKGDRRTLFHPRWFVQQRRPLALPHGCLREAHESGAPSDRLAPHPCRSAPRARRRGERLHRRATLRRWDLPRRTWVPAAEGLRVPRLLRSALQLT